MEHSSGPYTWKTYVNPPRRRRAIESMHAILRALRAENPQDNRHSEKRVLGVVSNSIIELAAPMALIRRVDSVERRSRSEPMTKLPFGKSSDVTLLSASLVSSPTLADRVSVPVSGLLVPAVSGR